ncbi:MAG: Kazal-type serine protease inhibitor domain-containing protein [Candidatus Pacearchaeota archaeon]|jgi:hypothetical protein
MKRAFIIALIGIFLLAFVSANNSSWQQNSSLSNYSNSTIKNQSSGCACITTEINKVCGTNGITYTTPCYANCAKVNYTSGACKTNLSETNQTSLGGCKNKYWIDNENKACGQKQFCGDYMYYGLQTFEDKKDCLKEVNKTQDNDENQTDNEEEDYNSGCNYRYWIDNENKACGQKEFCGAFMYYGLQTFEDKKDCERYVLSPENYSKQEKTCQNVNCVKSYSNYSLSNGRKAEVKVMPKTANEKAIERLGDLGFNVTLKEVPRNHKCAEKGGCNITETGPIPVYEFDAVKEGKMLGLFKVKGKVSMQVDAETGEVISVKKPWWTFMATGF